MVGGHETLFLYPFGFLVFAVDVKQLRQPVSRFS
jgi:hypothetical protein